MFRLPYILWPLLIACCWLALTDIALGRAGGGGGYGGGGGGGGGGFGGGGFGGSYSGSGGGGSPWVTFIVFAILIASWLIRAHFSKSSAIAPTQSGDRLRHRISQADHRRAEETMCASDPSFRAADFLARFTSAFLQIQTAWQKQNFDPVRHFVSDGILERFTLQIREQQDQGFRDHMEKLMIDVTQFAEANISNDICVLTVQVGASVVDYRVSLETNKYVSGNRAAEYFCEFWTFIRRSHVTSDGDRPGLIEGHCPNCGDRIQLNQVDSCASCQALLRSGAYDWVLSEITQACEWKPRDPRQSAAADHYRRTSDPGFNIQQLEDRASVIFYRLAMADRLADDAPLRKVAVESFCDMRRGVYERDSKGSTHSYPGNCAVGSVDLIGVLPKGDFDYALVEIRWAANQFSVAKDNVVRDLGQWRRYQHMFVLQRKQGIVTNLDRIVSSAHCPSCGAPETDIASHGCEFCGAVLNDGSQDWVLAEMHSMLAPTATHWQNQLAAHQAKTSSAPGALSRSALSDVEGLAWMVNLLAADHRIDDTERTAIDHLAKTQQVPPAMVAGMIEAAEAGDLPEPTPPDPKTGRIWLEQIADAAFWDGQIHDAEKATLTRLGNQIGLAPVDVMLLINKRKANQSRRIRSDQATAGSARSTTERDDLLIKILCCIVLADGRVEASERAAIRRMLTKLGNSSPPERIDRILDDFASQVKQHGLEREVERCVAQLDSEQWDAADVRLFRRAMTVAAKSDGSVHVREAQVARRLMEACKS